jgi:hypothetical protein
MDAGTYERVFCMEMEEHIYHDDPKVGPADVQTNLAQTHYFFIGNGYILGGLQICASDAGTIIGLALMKPDLFGFKRASLSMDADDGLRATQIDVVIGPYRHQPDPAAVRTKWSTNQGVPIVQVCWGGENFTLTEHFFCPDRSTPRLVRQLEFHNTSAQEQTITIETGLLKTPLSHSITLAADQIGSIILAYDLIFENEQWLARLELLSEAPLSEDVITFWKNLPQCNFNNPVLDHLFNIAKINLQHVISHTGAVDASIWQYNLEWVRDHSMMAIGLIMSGNYELARTMLARLLTQFVSPEGDTIDSGKQRSHHDIELDQNGLLLTAVRMYVDFTNDWSLVESHWDKIERTAEFPLQRIFCHKESGLLHNQREFWERHAHYGIRDGMELAYQLFVAMGLEHASHLAGHLEKTKLKDRWLQESKRLKQAMLQDTKFRLVEHGHLVKRRLVNGETQSEVIIDPSVQIPPNTPLIEPPPHFLNPDSSITLPIAWEFIPPDGELARNTLFQIERLWNQRWSIGGYGRYHVSSEPDSPGPWPFATMFIARAYFEHGQDDKVWRALNWLHSLASGVSGSWYEFYGPRVSPPCPQVGIVPWTWAEILMLFVHHIWGLRPRENGLIVRPRLLTGIDRMEGTFKIRNSTIHLQVNRAAEDQPPSCLIDDNPFDYSVEKGVKFTIKELQDYHIVINQ